MAVLLLVAEGIAHLADVAPARSFRTRDDGGGVYLELDRRGPLGDAQFHQERLPPKPRGCYRVVVLGGSTTFGHPFLPPASFADWLRLRLGWLLPDAAVEIWNFGANGLASPQLVHLLEDLQSAKPDLTILYCGHNEFLPSRWPRGRGHAAWWRTQALRTRIGRWALSGKTAAGGDPLPSARILESPLLDQATLARGHLRFRQNLARMLQHARGRVLLCVPASDRFLTPVERSHFAAATPTAVRSAVRQAVEAWSHAAPRAPGGPFDGLDLQEELRRVRTLRKRAPEVALLEYWEGRLLMTAGEPFVALEHLSRARDRDDHPIRATSAIVAALEQAAREHDSLLVDCRPLLESESGMGADHFVDYCHPTREAHRRIADAILHTLADHDVIAPRTKWRFGDEPAIEEQWRRLGVDRGAQAVEFAQRALAILSQAWFDPSAESALLSAEELIALALRDDSRCALAHASQGFVHLLRRDGVRATRSLHFAHELDASALEPFLRAYDEQEAVRALFAAAGLTRSVLLGE